MSDIIVKEIGDTSAALRAAARARQRKIDALTREQSRLEGAGVVFARPSWRKAKSPQQADKLSIIYPMDGGQRTRIYVGTDATKQKQALAAMRRGDRHRVCEQEKIALRAELQALLDELKGLWPIYGGAR